MEKRPETFFRFVMKNGIGIYQAVKDAIFSNFSSFKLAREEWLNFLNDESSKWLKHPKRYDEDYRSWFTENGYKMFIKHTLPKITKYIPENMIEEIVTSNPGNIVYRDEYQVFVKEE